MLTGKARGGVPIDGGDHDDGVGLMLRRLIAWSLGVFIIIAVAGLPLYVFPGDDPLPGEGTVMVLGPPTWQRVQKAQELLESGAASQVLVSVSPTGRQSAALYPPCAYPGFTCETPDPFTTKGEAEMLRDYLGTDADDQPVVVITFTPHVARTRYVFQKCFGSNVSVIGVPQDLNIIDWAYQYAYQSAAFLKAALTPCAS